MVRIIYISFFLLISTIGCVKENSVEPFNFDKDTPTWLKNKIDSISTDMQYYGTKVFRYDWNKSYVYHIMIPISSCAYCELYDSRGNKILPMNDKLFQDFLNHKKNEVLVWEWDD